MGLTQGTGTVVTVEVETLPQHDTLRKRIAQLVSLRDILTNSQRTIVVRDLLQGREDKLVAPTVDGHDRLKQSFDIPGYPGVTAKLVIRRASQRFERDSDRFRLGGILVKSRHAVHEATYFDAALETDPHALWFYGKLTCSFIDDLSNSYDDRVDEQLAPAADNPVPIVDPSRKSGLTKSHPFVEALFGEALRCLRPLVEEERQREERERASIESQATRKRLNALESAASKFMEESGEDEEPAREPDRKDTSRDLRERGFVLSPPFSQVVKGHAQKFWLNVNQRAYPEIEAGAIVQIECLSAHIASDRAFCGLDQHPSQDGILRALWTVSAVAATPATGLRARVGSIRAEAVLEVFDSEADRYSDVTELRFAKKRYTVTAGTKRKRVRIFAPLRLVPTAQRLQLSSSNKAFTFSGDPTITPRAELGVAISEVWINSAVDEASANLEARLGEHQATADIHSVQPAGTGIKIKLEAVDLGNQRYRWQQNVLVIAAQHPSVRRYLGSKAEGFPGQESKHFRILLAEIVADAVCTKIVSRCDDPNSQVYEGAADWDAYYARFDQLRTRFLPIAHRLQSPEEG